jgi:hypothetical protein
MLAERLACPAFGDSKCAPDVLDDGTPALGAYQFPFEASCRISLSNVRSDTAFLSRAFSCSRSPKQSQRKSLKIDLKSPKASK